jgi:glycosyltransferase involved in cell wall biosynthesis
MTPRHVLYLNYFYDPDIPDVAALLDRYYTTTHFCAAVRAAGVERVSVVQRFAQTRKLDRGGVTYYFVADPFGPELEWPQDPALVHALVAALQPDLIHHNGMVSPLSRLSLLLPDTTVLLWQDHGGAPPNCQDQPHEGRGFDRLDGVIFTAKEQAEAWHAAGLVGPGQAIYELMEGSTWFCGLPREASRRQSRFCGDPTFLWVGRLDRNKDPLTVLRGFAQVAPTLPDPHLYLVYGEDELLPEVAALVRQLGLASRVHLLGKQPHTALPTFYSAADFFVLGSHHEGSGYALLEAVACGLTAIVTDIPSFRRITGEGQLGPLWRPGCPEEFARAAAAAVRQPRERAAVRRYFEENWSFSAIGQAAAKIYREAHGRKRTSV